MDNIIINRKSLPKTVAALFPSDILFAIEAAELGAPIEEIRLKRGRAIWVSGGGKNLMLDYILTSGELEDILLRACGGSLYACAESMKRGFVAAGDGIRVGVCGQWTEGGVRNVTSLAIRIPRRINIDASGVRKLLDEFKMCRGLLVFSPPLGGKTSFLRETARALASGADPLRVVVVDSGGELDFSLDSRALCIDILSRYPRREGLEIASRTLGAQVVICDEIGAGEADAIRELHGGGVPLIASAHASDISDLLTKKGISELHACKVFGGYLELSRSLSPPYRFYSWEEADGS